MATAFEDETNARLRRMARELMRKNYEGKQKQLAEAVGVSASFISDFLNEKRGGGMDILVGLGRLDPLQLLEMLEIDPRVVANLVAIGDEDDERGTDVLPDVVRRAMRAAIEVTGCTPKEAFDRALEEFERHGEVHLDDAEWWFLKVRSGIVIRPKSGERPSVRLKKADISQA